MRVEDKCAIDTEGRVKYFFEDFFLEKKVSIKSENV